MFQYSNIFSLNFFLFVLKVNCKESENKFKEINELTQENGLAELEKRIDEIHKKLDFLIENSGLKVKNLNFELPRNKNNKQSNKKVTFVLFVS